MMRIFNAESHQALSYWPACLLESEKQARSQAQTSKGLLGKAKVEVGPSSDAQDLVH